jgi:hypothetical protein
VVAAYAWTAYQSDDNVDWTPVAISGPVVFGTFQNRFEIPVVETRARFLKVVTSPLPVGVTIDPQFANVLVTELQAFQVLAAEDVRGRRTSTAGALNGGVRHEFASVPGLSYDFATFLRHGGQLDRPTWTVTNGLGYVRKLRPALLLSARLERTDSDEARAGRTSSNRYAVTLAATPLPTLTASGTVSGQYTQSGTGSELRNSLVLVAAADLYQGVTVSASGSATRGTTDTGRTSRALDGRATASLVPHRTLTLSTTFAVYETRLEGGGLPATGQSVGRLEASGSFTPFRALYLSGSLIRQVWGEVPSTLANLGVNVAPLPGGALLLRFNYLESLDTSQDLRSRVIGPGLRWTIRPRWFLDVTYTWLDSSAPTLETHSRVFFANLLAVIG